MSRRAGRRGARRRPRTAGPDDAVSSVVSAVLVFALFASAFILWTATTLPVWIKDREATHQQEVRAELSGLQAGLDRLASVDERGPITASFPLGAPPVPLVQTAPSTGALAFEDGLAFTAAFTDPRLHEVDGVGRGLPSVPASGTLGGIEILAALQVRLTTTVGDSAEAWVQAAASDGTDTITARVRHVGSGGSEACAGAALEVRVTGAGPPTSTILHCGVGTDLTDQVVDVLDPRVPFAGALARLDPPLDLTFTSGTAGPGGPTVSAHYAARWSDADGRLRVAGDGESDPGFTLDRAGGLVVFRPQNREFVEQAVAWEGGAVIVAQPDGMNVAVAPGFTLGKDGTTGFLEWTFVDLDGSGSVQGTGTAQVSVTHVATSETVLSADSAVFTLVSPHAEAWRAFLGTQVAAAGADATVGGTGDTATLTLGSSTDWLLRVRLVSAQATVA